MKSELWCRLYGKLDNEVRCWVFVKHSSYVLLCAVSCCRLPFFFSYNIVTYVRFYVFLIEYNSQYSCQFSFKENICSIS
uniref:Uncharacterized protein n=1 Tax=Oryza brachyantha TaxID=4533 RepID=J3MH96_ORYBR